MFLPEVGHYFAARYPQDNIVCTRSQIHPSFCDAIGQPCADRIVSLSLQQSNCHTMYDIVVSSVGVMSNY